MNPWQTLVEAPVESQTRMNADLPSSYLTPSSRSASGTPPKTCFSFTGRTGIANGVMRTGRGYIAGAPWLPEAAAHPRTFAPSSPRARRLGLSGRKASARSTLSPFVVTSEGRGRGQVGISGFQERMLHCR